MPPSALADRSSDGAPSVGPCREYAPPHAGSLWRGARQRRGAVADFAQIHQVLPQRTCRFAIRPSDSFSVPPTYYRPRPFAALQNRRTERAGSARKRSSVQGIGCARRGRPRKKQRRDSHNPINSLSSALPGPTRLLFQFCQLSMCRKQSSFLDLLFRTKHLPEKL